ncbi:MAG TPA: HAD family hydrolase [Candidatus Brocadiia bacterium]|nr:HAD family hydrolase [Candidatus Brocadiia bacterium]
MPRFKAVFFDLDGTLWDSAKSAGHAIRAVSPRIVKRIPALSVPMIAKGLEKKLHELILERGLNSQEWLDQGEWFHRLFLEHGVDDNQFAQEIATAFKAARKLTMRSFVFPGVEETLEDLERDHALGLITNGHFRNQRMTLDSLGLTRFFTHIIVSGDEGIHKPDKRIFLRALEKAGVTAQETIYVGDTPKMDIPGARQVGITVVWFYSRRKSLPPGSPNPDYTITSIPELIDIVRNRKRYDTPTDFIQLPIQ